MNYKLYISPNYSNNSLQEISFDREISSISSGIINTINDIYNYLSANDDNC